MGHVRRAEFFWRKQRNIRTSLTLMTIVIMVLEMTAVKTITLLRRVAVVTLATKVSHKHTQVRGFKPGRSRRIFQGEKNSSARLPSEGK